MGEPRFPLLSSYQQFPPAVMQQRVDMFEAHLQRRHTVRKFSDRPVPRSIIEKCLLAAGSARFRSGSMRCVRSARTGTS